jgi:hypothetical protein
MDADGQLYDPVALSPVSSPLFRMGRRVDLTVCLNAVEDKQISGLAVNGVPVTRSFILHHSHYSDSNSSHMS